MIINGHSYENVCFYLLLQSQGEITDYERHYGCSLDSEQIPVTKVT